MRIRRPVLNILTKLTGPVYRPFRRKRVVMFHAGRSGSSVLGLMLNDHPDIHWSGEILKPENIEVYKKLKGKFDYKELMRWEENKSLCKCHGFEMKFEHIRQVGLTKEEFLDSVEKSGYTHFIILTRRNYLRKMTSGKVAKKTGRYHLGVRRQTQLVKVTLDTEELMMRFDEYAADIAEMQKLLESRLWLSLVYEDNVEKDPSKAYDLICRLLQVPPHPKSPKLKRINPYPLNEMILNFDKVVSTLRGTQYEWMLEL